MTYNNVCSFHVAIRYHSKATVNKTISPWCSKYVENPMKSLIVFLVSDAPILLVFPVQFFMFIL